MLILFLLNFIVIFSSYLLAYRIFKLNNPIDALICWFIIYYSQIVLEELVLGIAGLLYLDKLIFLNLALLLAVWLTCKNRGHSCAGINAKEAINLFFSNKIYSFITIALFSFVAVKIFINLTNPPLGWDSLNYHFTFPAEWLKNGNLKRPITIFDDPSPSYYPINGSLYYFWLMLPLHNSFLANIGQLPFFILSFISIFGISRKLKLSQKASFSAAAIVSLTPNFFKQLQIGYVDVMVAGLFLACLNYLFLLAEEFSWQNVLIFGLSAGLLLGTKTICLPYSALLLIPFIWLLIKNIKISYISIPVLLALIILGCFTYIKNYIDTGNPFYPLVFKVLNTTIFKGVMDIRTYSAHFKAADYTLSKMLFHEGLGIQAIILVLPALFLALPIAWFKKRRNLDFTLAYFLILPALIFLVYKFIIPLPNVRYLYPLLGCGVITAFYTIHIINLPDMFLEIILITCAFSSIFALAKRQELVFSLALTFTGFAIFVFCPRLKNMLAKRKTIIFALIILLLALIPLEKWYEKNEFKRYVKMVKYSGLWPDAASAWEWLDKNSNANNIAYTGRPVPYPLYASNLKNNVYYVSVNAVEPVKLHYFPNSHYEWGRDFESLHKNLQEKGNYRENPRYNIWLNNLLKHNTDFLFVYSLHQTKEVLFPVEQEWAKAHPERFNPRFQNKTISIYKLIK